MKILDYTTGFFNLSILPFLEVEIEKNTDSIYNINLVAPGKNVFLFSCEEREQASKFRTLFNQCLMNFIKNNQENYTHIFILIHVVVDQLLGGRR